MVNKFLAQVGDFGLILAKTYFNNRIIDYMICIVIFLVWVIVIKIIERIIIRRLKVWAEKTVTTVDDFLVLLVNRYVLPFFYFLGFYVSIQSLNIPKPLDHVVRYGVVGVITFFFVRLAIQLITYAFTVYWS